MIHFHSFLCSLYVCVSLSLSLSLSLKGSICIVFVVVGVVGTRLFVCFVLFLGVSPEFFKFCGVLRFFLLCFLSLERSTASFVVVVLKI